MTKKYYLPLALVGLFILLTGASLSGLFNAYIQMVLILMGINIILTVSLNLINGYMGEFSVGHAGFMSLGAYTSAFITTRVIPHLMWGEPLVPPGGLLYAFDVAAHLEGPIWHLVFPLTLLAGGLVAALGGLLVAIPSFRVRGDYLAIITLSVNYIVMCFFANMEALGGSRGITGIPEFTSVPMVFICTVISIWAIRNFIYSTYGKGIMAIREDEVSAEVMTVNTRRLKVLAFCTSSFFAGIGGGLLAHILLYINPATFTILKSIEPLVMVYLGGMSSISGSIIGAIVFTGLVEALRPLGLWRWVVIPLILIVLMLFRRKGIMGGREFGFLKPKKEVEYAPASD
ncbi:MAG: branched-chain amino acid ABC transporter permease [Chloroflexota bacterium]|nr:branched-chain amino acid ABC transporter permease [Chloroflexota bacterium]